MKPSKYKPGKFVFPEEMIVLVIVIVAMSFISEISPAYANTGWRSGTNIDGTLIVVPAYYANSPIGTWPDTLGGANINTLAPLRKLFNTHGA